MKRFLSILMIAAILCSITACGGEPLPESSAPVTTTTTTTEETTTEADTTTTAEETTATTTEETTTVAESTTATEETTATTTTAAGTTTRWTMPTGGTPVGISTMKGNTTTSFKGYTTTTTTTAPTATTTEPVEAEPVMNKPYVCRMVGGTDLIVATVTFTDEGCVITRTFYTCDTKHAVYGTDVETVTRGSLTYYKTSYAPQAAARYEIVGINIQVYNKDGSVAKTFVMPKSDAMECSFSDGVAFGRSNRFTLEEN